MDIRVQCSPDADDLFMMRGILEGRVDTGPYRFIIDTSPTDQLNRIASGDAPEVCAISVAHYPKIASTYQMLPHGGSMGEGYGPVVIAKQPMSLQELKGKRVGVPGLTTTAWSVLRMMVDVEPVVTPIVPYQLIFDALAAGDIDAGLVIHEGRLTFKDAGYHQVADLGEWWAAETGGLPLPLGANAIRRDLGPDHIRAISKILRDAIADGLEDRDAAIQWLLAKGTELPTASAVSEYLHMYANQRTLDYGEAGRQGIQTYFERGAAVGLFPPTAVDFSP